MRRLRGRAAIRATHPAKDGKVVLTQTDAKALCVTCHDDKAKLIETAKVPHPGAAGDCTDCHSPHASKQPGLPKTDAVSICLGCHSDIDDLRKKSVHHQPAFEQGAQPAIRLTAATTIICCAPRAMRFAWSATAPIQSRSEDEADHLLTIFNGTVRLPDDYYRRTRFRSSRLRFGLGHPVEYHPVSDVMDPTNQSKVKTPLSCLSCHQPHASAQADLLVKDQVNNMAFCDNCHKNRLNMKETTSPGKLSGD